MASQNIVIIINGSASTALSYTPSQESYTAPVAAGTVMGDFAVEPSAWSGTITLSGADAAKFNLNQLGGTTQLATAAELGAGAYNVTATSTP